PHRPEGGLLLVGVHDVEELRDVGVGLRRVLLGDDHRREKVRRDDLLAVVVLFGVVDVDLLALLELPGHLDRLLHEERGVLVDRGVLDALHDRLHRLDLGVLPGHDRDGLARLLHRGDDRPGERVVGREHTVELLRAIGRGEDRVHPALGVLSLPALGGGLLDVGLLGRDDERAVVDLRLEHIHRALEEHRRVGVIRRAREQLDVVGLRVSRPGGEPVEQRLPLQLA
ncbi:hypothetical protein ABE10_00175, partial [Bacillus toyonensis]|nr:hypothetical protein [Bacillus toyonensis]